MAKFTTVGIAILVILLLSMTFILTSLTTEFWTTGILRIGLWKTCNTDSSLCESNIEDPNWQVWKKAVAGLTTAAAAVLLVALIFIFFYNCFDGGHTKCVILTCGGLCLLSGIIELIAVIVWGIKVQGLRNTKNEFAFALAAVHAVVTIWAAFICFIESCRIKKADDPHFIVD